MLRKIQLLFAFALALPAASYGLVGGPWDNGDYNQILDESGIYQAALRFSNGQGFCQFGSNVDITSYIDITQAGTNASGSRGSAYSYLNRSVIYYKGVTYLGQAWGMVDMSRSPGTVEGYTNGNSDVSTSSTSAAPSNNLTITTSASNSATTLSGVATLVGNSGLGATCNTAWTAKIRAKKPILTFVGDGQLTVLNPDSATIIGQAVAALIGAIPSAATQQPPVLTGGTGTTIIYFDPIGAIIDAIERLQTLDLSGTVFPSAQSTYDAADKVPVKVYGSRKFFLSRR